MNLAKLYAEKICPVCGNQLDFSPQVADRDNELACLCCGIHFGHDDADAMHREDIYETWRRHWISYGKRWWRGKVPSDFNPDEQLRRLERLADDPLESKVSGGSKKHLCQSAESVRVPARHCWRIGTVAAIIPPSAESKITTIPANSCVFTSSA